MLFQEKIVISAAEEILYIVITCLRLTLITVEDRVQWTRAFEVFAMIAMTISVVCGISKELVFKTNHTLLKATGVSAITAGLCFCCM